MHLSHETQSILQDHRWKIPSSTHLDPLNIPLQWDPESETCRTLAIYWSTSTIFLQLPGFTKIPGVIADTNLLISVCFWRRINELRVFPNCTIGRSQREGRENQITASSEEKTRTTSLRVGRYISCCCLFINYSFVSLGAHDPAPKYSHGGANFL